MYFTFLFLDDGGVVIETTIYADDERAALIRLGQMYAGIDFSATDARKLAVRWTD